MIFFWKGAVAENEQGPILSHGGGNTHVAFAQKVEQNSKAYFQALKMCVYGTLFYRRVGLCCCCYKKLLNSKALSILIQKRNISFPVICVVTQETQILTFPVPEG